MPGWTSSSWGYHGDDGYSFAESTGTPYGETFGTGDIVGCKISSDGNVVFTKNGTSLGKEQKYLLVM
jgi:Ran-binding protein 9/10